VRCEHQHLCLKYRSVAEGKVNCHLVTVEVGVESRTDERVQLDCLAFNQLRLEGLDTQPVKCWCTVQQHRVTLENVLEDIPDNRILAVNDLLRALYSLDDAAFNELADHKRLVELGCHILRDTCLVKPEFRAHNDNRTCGVVNPLTEKVLAEASLLALEAVRERLERPVGVGLDGVGLA